MKYEREKLYPETDYIVCPYCKKKIRESRKAKRHIKKCSKK